MPVRVKDMLETGEACGLSTVGESYCQVMMHYDLFFDVSKLSLEIAQLESEMRQLDLIDNEGVMKEDMIIEKALDLCLDN